MNNENEKIFPQLWRASVYVIIPELAVTNLIMYSKEWKKEIRTVVQMWINVKSGFEIYSILHAVCVFPFLDFSGKKTFIHSKTLKFETILTY